MVVVGVAGGSGSGKTTLVDRLSDKLGRNRAAVLAHDRYYRDLSTIAPEIRSDFNFDHPDALDTSLLVEHLERLRAGQAIHAPVYDFARHIRDARVEYIIPRPIMFVEGVLTLADARLRDLMNLRVFVHTEEHVRFARRMQRDVAERGRTVESVQAQYAATVRPMHDTFVEPSRRYADIVITEGGFNDEAVERVTVAIRTLDAGRLLKRPAT